MKKTKKLVALIIAVVMCLAAVVALAACQPDCANGNHRWGNDNRCTACGALKPDYDGVLLSIADYRAYAKADLDSVKGSIGSINATVDAAVNAALAAGKTAIDAAESVTAVQKAFSDAKTAMMNCVPLAQGLFDLTGVSNAERTKILGIMEDFAIRTGLTGTTLFENGRYQIYRDRVTLGTENYINGYGFGTLAEGNITAALDAEQNQAWKMYYHTITSENPNDMNYLDSQASTVGDFYGYIGASYFTNFMNSTKDGYDWVPELAVTNPEPVGALNEAGQTATWRFEIRKDLKYSTLGSRTAYNNRAVALEDYLTPYKLMLNAKNNYYRGSEMSKQTGASTILNAGAYYAASKKVDKEGILSLEDLNFNAVGLKTYEENGKWYFQYTLGAPVNAFFARYYISSSLYMPIPEDFINEVGVANYLRFNEDKTTTPVDNSLSLGAYTLESWSDTQIVFKKNPNYVFADTKYAIQGVHINVLTAAQNDPEAAIKEFEAGRIDACGIPSTYIDKYKNNPRTHKTIGDSCFKLNMNALNATDWAKLFGENGTVEQNTPAQYWNVKPAMSNAHFRSALSYALNRAEFADAKGRVASVDFFSPNYMSDPENGVYYYTTDAHKSALENIVDSNTDAYGYSLELARDYFRMAIDELEAAGAYTRGTVENPTVIELEVAWQSPSDEEDMHKYIKQYWETAFNDPSVHGGRYKLDVKFWVGNSWMDTYNEKLLVGQYDIGFGSISGNTLDPLSFFNVLSTDMSISNNFTLNWAIDTNDPNADVLVYNGMRWSWDALYSATQQPTMVSDGAKTAAVAVAKCEATPAGDNVNVTIELAIAKGVTLNTEDYDVVIFAGGSSATDPYNEYSVADWITEELTVDGQKATIKLVLTPDAFAQLPKSPRQGFDFYFGWTIANGDNPVVVDVDYMQSITLTLFSVAD